nr:phospho-sugar mutase [Shimazuella soli]
MHAPVLTKKERAQLQNYTFKEQQEFEKKLSFGTAGIRGAMGLGPHRLNRFTIRQVSEAFYRYLLATNPSNLHRGIVIAYDNRHCSRLFAEEAACLFAYHQVPVYLYSHIHPTPMLSYAIRHLQAIGGIMITASHNPPSDNGFKVYGKDGAQLLPACAKLIEQHMNAIADVLTIPTLSYVHAQQIGKIREVPKEVDQTYYHAVQSLISCSSSDQSLSVVYTPLHGTGQVALPYLLQKESFISTYLVTEQGKAHPDFPTVSSPNPEDVAAFTLAKKVAKNVNADLILATDPDADRVGIMIPYQNDYIHLTGNQIGTLLLYYLLTVKQKKGTIYSTIVSTSLAQKIAHHYGRKTAQTLTGFKYIAEQIEKNQDLLLGFEESCGYLLDDFVRDKDGIQTSFYLCHVAAYYKKQGKTFLDVLDDIYRQYGYHVSKVISLPITTKRDIIDDFFNLWNDAGEKLDYRTGLDHLPKAEVGKVWFPDKSWIAIRPSGTEPKVKIYMEAVGKNQKEANQKMLEICDVIKQNF